MKDRRVNPRDRRMTVSIDFHEDTRQHTSVVKPCEEAMVEAAERVIDRHYERRKTAATEMGIDGPRLAKMLSAKTLDDVHGKRGEHLSVQCLQRMATESEAGFAAIQDWIVAVAGDYGLTVIRSERQIEAEQRTVSQRLGEVVENILKLQQLEEERRHRDAYQRTVVNGSRK